MLKRTLTILWTATAMGAVGCGQSADDVQSTEGAVIGAALPGTDAAAFAAAKANFEQTETVQARSSTSAAARPVTRTA
jgi:hypothetical protein